MGYPVFRGMCYEGVSSAAERLTLPRIGDKIISTLRKVTPSCESDQYVRALSLDDRISLKARSVPGLSPNEVLASRDSAFHKDGPGKRSEREPEPDQHSRKATAMATENTNPTTPDNATELWCSVCGCHLEVTVNDYRPYILRTSLDGTCRNRECPMVGNTLSPESWLDQNKLSRYSPRAIVQFDVWSGIVMTPVDQDLANQIAWLVGQYDPEETIRFEGWIVKHHQDADFHLMIAAFVEGIKSTPDYSAVCDTHLEGR